MDYKETLNLPKTSFPMKANLPQREPQILQRWEELKLYLHLMEEQTGRTPFILHDGPPYANGRIHIGHALNKILKDFVVKSKAMEGKASPFVPGWDCHGLPIEFQVLKSLGPKKKEMSLLNIRKVCREYAQKFVNIQKEEFKRLGVFGHWEDPYLTMTPAYEASIVREFGKVVAAGGVYKGKKPVLWCPFDETALAEAEVEYGDHTSPSIFVKFQLNYKPSTLTSEAGFGIVFPKGVISVSLVIWTTTPWTLPANQAVCLHPDHMYDFLQVGEEVFVVATKLADRVAKHCGWINYQRLGSKKGSDNFEGLQCLHPIIEGKKSHVVLGEFVTMDEGTGIVHIAPGHGREDFQLAEEYNNPSNMKVLEEKIAVMAPVDERGRFTKEVGEGDLVGKNVFDANPLIKNKLKEKGILLGEGSIVHSYPHCWRCKNPVIFRATEQWFISMDVNDLRKRALEEIDKVQWVPKWGKDRIFGMIENRPDWCISRQRVWGVPIVAFTCQNCQEALVLPEVIDYIAGQMEQEGGSDIWFSKKEEELLPKGVSCRHCKGTRFKKENDILDVWFESGVSHSAVLKRRSELRWPADLYLEGSDQHRGWFHSALLSSLQTDHQAPYKAVLTHGFVVDGSGKKMSKSAGNVVSPQEVIERYGAEILRLWVASTDFREDVRISSEILSQSVETYRKIRNTCRFLLGNLYDFDPEKDRVEEETFFEIDHWVLERLAQLVKKVRQGYSDYEFHIVIHALNHFCAVDLSSVYLDILKDRLYVTDPTSPERRAAQQVMYNILVAMTKLMAPVLSFTADEIWNALTEGKKKSSIFLTLFPESEIGTADDSLCERWDKLLQIRNNVSKELEIARQKKEIGHSLEASVDLFAEGDLLEFLRGYEKEMPALFIVSTVNIFSRPQGDSEASGSTIDRSTTNGKKMPQAVPGETMKGLAVRVSRSVYPKCERCWMYLPSVGTHKKHPTLCSRCYWVLSKGLGRES